MKSKLLLLAAGFAGALALGPACAFGYTLEGETWPDGQIVMNLQLGSNSGTLIDGSTSWGASAEDALAIWNQYLVRVQFAIVRDSTIPISHGDGQNSVFFASNVFGDSFGSDTLAVTARLTQGGANVEADVVFNNAQPFNSYRGPLQTTSSGGYLNDFHRIALHEFGHVLGLDHPDDAGQNVNAQMNSRESDLDALTTDDISGAQYLYGSGSSNPTPTPVPTPASSSTNNLVNLSTRAFVGSGDRALIGGFIIQGFEPKQVLLRAIGPSLGAAGVQGALADPTLELHDAGGTLLASNDDWGDSQNAQAIANTGAAPSNSAEAAILTTLNPGNYTAVVRGYNDGTGVGLVELYDLAGTKGRAANISTRGRVLTGESVMIGGFIIGGNQTKPVIVRGLGPSLANAGVTGPLADPTVELRDANGTLIDFNDDWMDNPHRADISNRQLAPSSDAESAIGVTLNPGHYTAILRGYNDTIGVGLVEVYDLSPPENQ